MLKRLTRLASSGDTIIEVMIVLAVLGLAIGLAYSTAHRSLLDARQAQENSEATQMVQSQIEALRTMTQSAAPNNIFQGGPYCLSQTAPYTIITGNSCTFGAIGYHIDITYTASPTDTFTVKATWPDIFGEGNDTVTMNYRLHTPNPAAFAPPPVTPPPPPTVSLSASPTSVAEGSASTLTWSSNNASLGCVALGAWSGSKPTSGSQSTGALSTASTFTLVCSGAGGNASASATVNVTCPVGQTGTPPNCGTCPAWETGTYPNCQPFSF